MKELLLIGLGVVIGVLVENLFFKKKKCDDDPTGEKKQAIYDAIVTLKQDIETTV